MRRLSASEDVSFSQNRMSGGETRDKQLFALGTFLIAV